MNVFDLVGSFVIKGVDSANAQIDSVTSKAKAGFSETEKAAEGASGGIAGALGKVGSALGTAAKVGIAALATTATVATGALMGVASQSLQAYASFEQLTGGVETLFEDSAETVEQYAAGAYQTAGLSANAYMETVTSFSASLLQGLGGDTAAAAEYANMAVTDMSDNANKMGTSMSSIQDAYQGFAKQNYTMLDNLKLGYGGTASEMARLINDSGVLGDSMEVTAETVNEVSFDKMIEAIHTVQTEMGITGTTALEASTTIEGSVNSAKAAWTNWVTGLADDNADMELLTAQLVESVATAASNIVPRLGQILTTLGTTLVAELPSVFSQLQAGMGQYGPPLLQAAGKLFMMVCQALIEIAPDLLSYLLGLLNQLVGYLVENMPMIVDGALTFFGGLLTALLEATPQILAGLIQLLGALLATLAEKVGEFVGAALNLFLGIGEGFTAADLGSVAMGIFQGIYDIASGIFTAILGVAFGFVAGVLDALGFHGAAETVMAVFNAIKSFIEDPIGTAKGIVESAVNAVKGFLNFDGAVAAVTGVFSAAKSAIEGPINTAKDIVGKAVDAIRGFFNFQFKWPHIPLPHFSISGSVNPLDWLTQGVPSIGIDWYAKAMDAGMIMDEPTVFGYNAARGELMAGGEAGSETVVGTQSLMQMITSAVSDAQNPSRTEELLAAILAAFRSFLDAYDPNTRLVMDTGALVGEIDRGMAARQRRRER